MKKLYACVVLLLLAGVRGEAQSSLTLYDNASAIP
jgi:hypothetical protein